MKILAMSDLHGHLPKLPEVDVVCIAGDITPYYYRQDAESQWRWYNDVYLLWVEQQPCRHLITVAGNNDYCFESYAPLSTPKHLYLENTGVVIDGVSFYGTPNTPKPCNCKAFSKRSEKLVELFHKIPQRVDVLVCHTTPHGVNECGVMASNGIDKGCIELTEALRERDIKMVVCGHIHTGNHTSAPWLGKTVVNVAHCNEYKKPEFPPFIFEL